MKKLLSGILALSMLGALLSFPAALAEADMTGYYWLEAENGEYNEAVYTKQVDREDLASGGKYLSSVGTTDNYPAEQKDLCISMDFEVADEGRYDIWAVVLDTSNLYTGNFAFNLNGKALSINADGYYHNGDYGVRQNTQLYTTYMGSQVGMYWVKVASAEFLQAGKNNLTYIGGARRDGTKVTRLAFDCAAVVPTYWNWGVDTEINPDMDRKENYYAWLEMESPENEFKWTQKVDSANAANQAFLYAKTDGSSPVDPEKLWYSFDLAVDGQYDIWYLGNTTAVHFSQMAWGIDTKTPENKVNTNVQTYIETPMYSYYGAGLNWIQLAEDISLTAGRHTFYTEYAQSGQARHYILADAAIIVPAAWNWSAPETATHPDLTACRADVSNIENILKKTSVLTENLALPTVGISGSAYTYSSDKPENLTDSGAVTRPSYGSPDVEATLAVKAVRNSQEANGSINFVIPAEAKYEYQNFAVQYTDGSAVGLELTGGKSVAAQAEIRSSIGGSALMILALYDADNSLREIASTATSEIATDFTAANVSLTLPEDVSGCYLKAYIWENWESAAPIMETPYQN